MDMDFCLRHNQYDIGHGLCSLQVTVYEVPSADLPHESFDTSPSLPKRATSTLTRPVMDPRYPVEDFALDGKIMVTSLLRIPVVSKYSDVPPYGSRLVRKSCLIS